MDYLTAWQNGIPALRSDGSSPEPTLWTENSDKRLVALTLAGDEQAYELIFDRYKRLVASIAARYFDQSAHVEEIIQITFTKAFFELANFRGDSQLSFASWLGKIAANSSLDTLRNQKRKPENLISELSEAETEILFSLNSNGSSCGEKELVDRDLATKLLSKLGPEDRSVLRMLHSEGMNISEIAESMNWSRSKVKLRAWRARNQLRKVLKRYL
jgi:RNA polymerase sigma-70 factor (ECF subfamily)